MGVVRGCQRGLGKNKALPTSHPNHYTHTALIPREMRCHPCQPNPSSPTRPGWQKSHRSLLRFLGSVLVQLGPLHLGISPPDRLVLAVDPLDPVKVVQGRQHGALLPQDVTLEPPGQPGEDLVPHKGTGRDGKYCDRR